MLELWLFCLKICQELSSLGHSSVSPLFAWEGAGDVYGNAAVVIVMWKEQLCLCWNFVFFIVLMKQPGLGGNAEGHLKKKHAMVFLASLPNKIWSYWHYIIDRMLECHTNVKSIEINDSSINWVDIWAQLGNVPYFIGMLGAAEGVACWKLPGLGYLLLGVLMWVPAPLCVWSLHCWRGSLGMLGTSPGRRQALCIYQIFSAAVP